MTPERYQQIKHIYLEARNLSGAARAACLIDACAGDAELRAEVERYLADEVEATTFLQSIHLTEVDEQPSVSVGPATPAPSP